MAIIVFNNALSVGFYIGDLYFVALGSIFSVLFFYSLKESKKINMHMVFLIIACLTSILINDVPPLFKPYVRFLLFVMILYLVGPLIISTSLMSFRFKLFSLLNKINLVIVVLSLLGLVTGVYRGVAVNWMGHTRIDFTGLYNHSMLLGPMAGISVLTSFFYYFRKRNNKKQRLLLVVCVFFSFITVVAAGSRGALIATVLGSLFFLYKIYQGRLSKYLSTVLVIVAALTISFPLWEDKADFLNSKMDRDAVDDPFDSRTTKWNQRIVEFQSSPIFGIGFASIDINGLDDYNAITGTIEPGSSWLTILSMTGLFGLLPILFLFLRNLLFMIKYDRNRNYTSFVGGLLILVTVHMIIEGYVFASGAFLFFYLWLLLGIIEGYLSIEKINKINNYELEKFK
ncbi:O-antigen ligase family protein [uncultured Gelidibacter sp.]|uniref:O-antigen ligase family protein n=1 Tax=uncultured Gelidibacter sp. TaxID=259318 RepID=UPI0026299D15|nr:O-antigen ligase family protein [uncultured Gelidibacter sp.]